MYCAQCGNQLEDNVRFCPACGKPVGNSPSKEQATEMTFDKEIEQETEMTFTKAVELAKAGRDEGYQFLYEKTCKNKLYIAVKYMKNEEAARDVLQDAYIKAFAKLDTLEDPEKFPGWIGIIVANTAKNALQKKNPILFSQIEQENDEGEIVEYQIEDESALNQPEVAYTQQETQQLVRELIDSLSEDQKMCILMFHIEGISIKEIAETMGCSENTVKSRLNYGRKNIKEKAEELQKKGVKLYSSAPIALFVYLLQKETGFFALSETAQGMATFAGSGIVVENLAGVAGTGGVTGASGATGVAGIDGAQGTGGITGISGMQGAGGAVDSGGTTGASSVAQTVGKAAGKKFFQTVAGKVTVGAAIAALIGVDILLYNLASKQEEAEQTTTQVVEQTEATTEAVTEETTTEEQLSEEDIYYAYLQDELIPKYGLVETYDSTNLPSEEEVYATDAMLTWNETDEHDWLDAEGILAADIFDYDQDGVKDLLLVYNERKTLYEYGTKDYLVLQLTMYTIEESQVVSKVTSNMKWGENAVESGKLAVNDGHYCSIILNRVMVDDVCYLVFSDEYGSSIYLGDGWSIGYQVLEYNENQFMTVESGGGFFDGYWYDNYADGEYVDTVEVDYTKRDTMQNHFREMGIDLILDGHYGAEQEIGEYNISNADAQCIAAQTMRWEHEDMYSPIFVEYILKDGTNLRD